MTNTNDYQTPEQGTLDWHIPLNDNFSAIETDIQNLADNVGVSNVGGYDTPVQGTLDWHTPLNDNFSAIETDVQKLADNVGVSGVGGYNTPVQGTLDWHIPLNDNFNNIVADLTAIADAVESSSSGDSTLSNANVWQTALGSSVDTSGTVYDATTYSGETLSRQVQNAFDAARSGVDGRAVVHVPSGSYTWDTTVDIVTGEIMGPTFLFDADAEIDVTADWSFDIARSSNGSRPYPLANDPRMQVHIYGGDWRLSGTGWVRATDIYSGLISGASVSGGKHALWGRNYEDWSEGWSVRDTSFTSVDRPLRFSGANAIGGSGTTSFDQQLLANLTFRDFAKAIQYEQSSCQNHTAVDLVFENPRDGATGVHYGNYTTGTVYRPQWPSSTGTVFQFDDWAKPSIVDPDVADGATLSVVTEGDAEVISSSAPAWQQAQKSPIVNDGGPKIPTPVIQADTYTGSLPDRVEAAAEDLPNGGTVLISGQGNYNWDSTVTLDVAGRDMAVVTPRNVEFDVTTDGWAWDVTGDGTFSIYGGFWKGQNDDSSQSGWLTTDVPNLNVSVNAIWRFEYGSAIDASPRSKGRYRVFDTRISHVVNQGNPDNNACIQIGGAGCSQLLLSHIETSDTLMCYRFDAPIDDFDGMRLSAHPWVNNSVFAETNAEVDGTWFNMKWEGPGESGTVIFDNENSSSPAAVVEPWAWAGSENIELWRGTEPQFFPLMNTRVDSKFAP